jgi:hypothetical protein
MAGMRAILALLALTGCTSENGPHDVVTCDSSWNDTSGHGPIGCESACEKEHPEVFLPNAARCMIDTTDQVTKNCAYIDADGVKGCCEAVSSATPIRFYECADQ